MKYASRNNHPDIIIMYQDRDSIDPAIDQINSLKLNFSAYKFHQKKLAEIAIQKPKVLLISSNDVKKSIQLYINYLEEYEQKIAPHRAILLINNRESANAYLACENGLFDNLEKLVAEGEEELASCIEHGVTLKSAFMHEVDKCESTLLSTVNKIIDDDKVKAVLENLISASLTEMNGNISKTTQNILDQLITLKQNAQSIKQQIEVTQAQNKKTIVGVNTKSLTSNDDGGKNPTLSYKVLIAEPSSLFSRVIDEMFAETVFDYLLVHDGQTALTQIAAYNPDAILMAYDLPKLNGIEVTKAIREAGNKTPIIAYTHFNDKKIIKRWIPLGLSSYIIKPSKKSIILKSITQALKNPVDILYHKVTDKEEIHWIPEYSVGNKEMDEQHKMLFLMINEFFHQDDKEAVVTLFQGLTNYIDLHFKAEEDLLRQINYPKTAEHISKHNELRDKFHLLEQKLDHYNLDLHHKISTFLYNWLTSHILKADMDYKSYALSIEETSFNKGKI